MRIYPAALNNILQVIIGLPVTDKVNFFNSQFSSTFVANYNNTVFTALRMGKAANTLEKINAWRKNTMVEHLGIELTEVGEGYLCGKMPVDHRTHQPMGLLHGGASVALAETLGSIGAQLQVDQSKYACVGLEINAN